MTLHTLILEFDNLLRIIVTVTGVLIVTGDLIHPRRLYYSVIYYHH